MFVHIIPSSVWAAEWPPLGKELLTGLSICSLCSFLIFLPFLYFSPAVSPFILPQTWTQLFLVRAFTYNVYSPTTIIFLKKCLLYYMSLTGNGSLTSAAGQPCSCCATVCSCRTFRSILATVLRQTQGSRKLFARLPCGLRETNARID